MILIFVSFATGFQKQQKMKQPLRPVMFVGTCSDAGKSVINAAFCRIFRQDGYRPAPFKAQNMSLNSFPTAEGGEMGRAQVVQAQACGIAPHTDMNPVLLKPTGEQTSQVVVNGRAVGNVTAREYFGDGDRHEALFAEAVQAFRRLEARYNPIVLEGAGSISELNLRDRDITNLRMALAAGAATYLVADIDRGGVIGSVYGTIALLRPEELALMAGIIINKFRGDRTLFEDGRRIIEELTGIPVVGVVPWFRDIRIEQEDSVAPEMKTNRYRPGSINVAVLLLRRMSNFTDFDVLATDPRFNAYYTNDPGDLERAGIVLLPGSKNTLADLQFLRATGMADAVVRAAANGKKVVGICGGYQMMGQRLEDPHGVEGDLRSVPGLGLLPQYTVMTPEKTTRQCRFAFLPGRGPQEEAGGFDCRGYEIHMGRTFLSPPAGARPLARLEDGQPEGYYRDSRCWGSYLHGIFDNAAVLDHLAEGFGCAAGQAAFDYAAFRETQYDRLAGVVRANVDLEKIYRSMQPLQ